MSVRKQLACRGRDLVDTFASALRLAWRIQTRPCDHQVPIVVARPQPDDRRVPAGEDRVDVWECSLSARSDFPGCESEQSAFVRKCSGGTQAESAYARSQPARRASALHHATEVGMVALQPGEGLRPKGAELRDDARFGRS